MRVDLSTAAGFPLALDVRTLEMISDGQVKLGRTARRKAELAGVLLDADGLSPATELYWNLPLVDAGPAADLLLQTGLTYSCVLLPPLKVGREFVKTQGHYHPSMAGSDIPYPEVYTHLWGEPSLLLQRRRNGRADEVDDCVLIELRDGAVVTIPPGYAHVLINPSAQPAAVAGLYSRAFTPVYQPILEMAGAAYYLVDAGDNQVLANPRYVASAPLRRMNGTADSPFEPPDAGRPLWTSFLADADRYAFLSQPERAWQRFPQETGA
jgi:oxalate decarboxylase/phosphoglucose isomerase-like protein (cupin superfamily)